MRGALATIVTAAALVASAPSFAAGGSMHLLSPGTDLDDKASLQRGAKYFMNYCSGCHGISFMRYNRIGSDLGIGDELVRENLLFTGKKVGDKVVSAMSAEDGEAWFGVAPPDLSVIARSRGLDWLYSYLVTYYEDPDPSRPYGVNNVVYPGVGMPHVLWSLQGRQVLNRAERPENVVAEHPVALEVASDSIRVVKTLDIKNGEEVSHARIVDRLEVVEPGEMAGGEYRRAVADLVNFLDYVGEPAKLSRYRMGLWVLAFLAVFFVLTRALYKEYWRDVR